MGFSAVCVFAGSRAGKLGDYTEAARQLGELLAREEIGIVYGGGAVGLMGELAAAALAAGGQVTGVIPQFLVDREVARHDLTVLEVVDTMHTRKRRMFELSDGFIALPGGLGTLEELFEMLTWAQLGRHDKPCGLLNIAGYYDGLREFVDHSIDHGFVRPEHRALLQIGEQPVQLLQQMRSATMAAPVDKWG